MVCIAEQKKNFLEKNVGDIPKCNVLQKRKKFTFNWYWWAIYLFKFPSPKKGAYSLPPSSRALENHRGKVSFWNVGCTVPKLRFLVSFVYTFPTTIFPLFLKQWTFIIEIMEFSIYLYLKTPTYTSCMCMSKLYSNFLYSNSSRVL